MSEPGTPEYEATRERLISMYLQTGSGRSKLSQAMIAPAQNVLDFWPINRPAVESSRTYLLGVMDRVVERLDGSETFDPRFLRLRSALRALMPSTSPTRFERAPVVSENDPEPQAT